MAGDFGAFAEGLKGVGTLPADNATTQPFSAFAAGLPKPTVAGTDADFLAAAGGQPSFASTEGGAAAGRTLRPVKGAGKGAIAERGLSLAAATGDQILGIPAGIYSVVKDMGGRLGALAAGASHSEQSAAGRRAADTPILPGLAGQIESDFAQPLQAALRAAGYNPFDQSSVSRAIDTVADWTGKASRGTLNKDDANSLISEFMNLGGLQLGRALVARSREVPQAGEVPKPRLKGPLAESVPVGTKPRLRGPMAKAQSVVEMKPNAAAFGKAAAAAAAGVAGYELGSQMDQDQLAALGGAAAVFIPAVEGTRLQKFRELTGLGASPEAKWKVTGLFQHEKTGSILQELSDRDIRFRRNLELADVHQPGVRFALNEFLDHPELKRLPENIQAKLQKVLVEKLESKTLAGEVVQEADLKSPDVVKTVMRLVPNRFVSMMRTAVHELQHTLDMAYRQPRGGSVEEFLPANFEQRRAAARNVAETQKLEEQHAAARDKYDRLVGENMAVAAERRMHLTEEQRRARPPWLDMPRQMKDQIVRLGLGIQSAVKEKGGMWHPEAVERLSEPLARTLARFSGMLLRDLKLPDEQLVKPASGRPLDDARAQLLVDIAKDRSLVAWADKSIRTYLNRYAGTAADPLKDVRIPMLGDTARWEDVTDRVFSSKPASEYYKRDQTSIPSKTPMNEPIWGTQIGRNEFSAVQSYLSHVGDYLREHVPADQLQRYDLVRAVRETAAQDARQAAKMAKARATGAGTVLYKDYGDGMKWVEVGKGADREVNDAALKAEGDVMGHCVGGYCEMVHEGQSRIYSLRDKEGMSHVTVEVSPRSRGVHTPADVEPGEDIVQIKGKQNRAPVAKYLPYVQDFVKSGKWGEVGDLQNASLYKTEEGGVAKYLTQPEAIEEAKRIVEPWKGTGRRWNGATAENILEQLREPEAYSSSHRLVQDILQLRGQVDLRQRGSADPKTLAAIAAAGVGAAVGSQIDPNHPWLGGALGALSGAAATRFVPMAARGLLDATRAVLSPGSPYERLKAAGKELVPAPIASAFAKDSRIRIKEQMDAAEVFEKRQGLEASRDIIRVMELAPKEAERAQVAHAIEANAVGGLPPKLQQAARQAQGMFDRLGQLGLAAGTVKDLLDHYVTHVFGREALPFLDELMRDRNIGSATSPFGKTRRGPPTISEVNAWMAKKGQPPITADIAKIMTAYSNSMIKAIANRQLINTLKVTGAPAIKNGQTIQRAVVTFKPIGNYVPLGRYNLYVHPDILPALRFAFEQDNVPGLLRGIEGVNTALKRTAVSFSLFHAKSLVDAMAGGAKLSKKTVVAGALGGAAFAAATDNDPIVYAMIGIGLGMAAPGLKLVAQAAAPKLFGENRYIKALRQNDPALAKMIDLSFEGGLQYSLKGGAVAVEEASKGFYEGLEFARKGLDSLVPGSGKLVKGVEVANQAMDTFMWDRLHTAMKLEVFAKTYETMLENNVKANGRNSKIALMSEKQVAEAAASYTNDIFGGLNWRRIAEEGFTRWGRDIKMGVYRPGGRRILRLAMFAPDWTISTTRAALKSLGGLVGQLEGSGLRGLVSPRTAADFHRQYMLRSAFYYAMLGDGVNYAMTGHHLWQNKDPTYVELGDGRKMQFSKHTMEPYHWMMHPVQQALNKLGQVPKETLNQLLGTEYLNPREGRGGSIYAGPQMKSGRLAHLGSQLSPIGVQQFAEGPSGGVLGAVGMPIYGKKTVDIAAEKAAKARQRARDKKRTGR